MHRPNSEPTASAPSSDLAGASYEAVLRANVDLHSQLAATYKSHEPHYRPENIAHVRSVMQELTRRTQGKRMLDLGCGAGFMVDIARDLVTHIDGVDITPAMLSQIDLSGPASIRLFESDTATVSVSEGAYDLVTSYAFLHHLKDIGPSLRTAARALREGGVYYADLDPNAHFWEAANALGDRNDLHPILKREVDSVLSMDEQLEAKFGVAPDTFNLAEYGKSLRGGFSEDDLVAQLKSAGFRHVEVKYYWHIGQARIAHDASLDDRTRAIVLEQIGSMLAASQPLSRALYKYIGFVATR
jgi:SAM-dependent methyltransferase